MDSPALSVARAGIDSLTCSVVICAYTLERWEDLEAAVASAQSQSLLPAEVLVVVDHAPDLLARATERWSDADRVPVRVMASRGAPGLSGARNTGSSAARGDIVVFLDDDARAEEDWLAQLVGAYTDTTVAVGGRVDPDLRAVRPAWWPAEFDWVIGCSYVGLPTERAEVRNVIGANMSVRRRAVDAVGGFAEDLGRVGKTPLGCEETDLCIRLRQADPAARVVYEPAARVHHNVPAARLTLRYFAARCFAEGISKARVAARVGRDDALVSERNHARAILAPALLAAARARAVRRALAIAVGLACALAGYARGTRFDHLARTALSLIANTVTTSVLGMLFWVVAARHYAPARFGEDAALIAAMVMLSSVAQLNLNVGLPRLLPQVAERRWRPVLAAYAAAIAVSVVVTAAFVTAAGLSANFAFLSEQPGVAFALIPAVALWSVFALQDAVLVSTRLAPLVPIENAVFGLMKVALVVVLADRFDGHGVFASWLLAMVILVVPVNALVFGRALRRRDGVRPTPSEVLSVDAAGPVRRYLALDYLAALMSQGSTALLPVLVVAVLGREANAYFYVAFLIASAFASVANAVATAVVAEGAHDESQATALVRKAAGWYLAFAVPGVAVVMLAAAPVLGLFGGLYESEATTLLRLLVLGTVPQTVVTLRVAAERVRGNASRVAAIEAMTVVVVTLSAITGMRLGGLEGLGLAWLAAHTAMAAIVLPVPRRVRRPLALRRI